MTQIATTQVAERLVREAKEQGLHFATAESCTAGLVSSLVAEVPGASNVLWGAFVTYTLDAKTVLLGVEPALLKQSGAVSSATACAMAQGALVRAKVDGAVSVTGLAGPDGDGSGQPVGTVWFGLALKGKETQSFRYHFRGSRNEVRRQAAEEALEILYKGLF
jgi:PncC family amidohydrolase